MFVTIRQKVLYRTFMYGIAAVILNWFAFVYLSFEDINNADLSLLNGKAVILDPGHGGIDSGATANGVIEKEITLQVAMKLKEILTEHGAGVTLTRNGDVDYYTRGRGGKRHDLLKRIEMVNSSGAALFVSIHCNAFSMPSLFGAQVFYNDKLSDNKQLAEIMQQALKEFPPGNKRQAKQDLNILVLNATNIPGVLVETGYITNKDEAAKLANNSYQEQLALQMAKAIAYHFAHGVAR